MCHAAEAASLDAPGPACIFACATKGWSQVQEAASPRRTCVTALPLYPCYSPLAATRLLALPVARPFDLDFHSTCVHLHPATHSALSADLAVPAFS